MESLVGKQLGKHQIDSLAGQGAMAAVYRAHHTVLGRRVAIKVIHPFLATDEKYRARFLREARLAASLRHPSIVQIYDFDVEDHISYIVMEYIPGPTLKERLRELHRTGELMDLAEVQRILSSIAEGLDYAHSRGMVHRDVKPANILFTDAGDAILADLGIARVLDTTQLTATGSVTGTPAYLSPEQGRGDPSDSRSDVYSLGVILYEMVSGRLPFSAETASGMITKHLTQKPPSLLRSRPGLSPAVENVTLRALSKDPERRYQTAGALTRAFQRALWRGSEAISTAQEATVVDDLPSGERPQMEPSPLPEKGVDAASALSEVAPTTPDSEAFTQVDQRLPVDASEEHPSPIESSGARAVVAPADRTRRVSVTWQSLPWKWISGGLAGLAVIAVIVAAATGQFSGGSQVGRRPALPGGGTGFALDNADPGFRIVSGDWGVCDYGECGGVAYPPNFRYADVGCIECEARFDFDIPQSGVYEVWAWWPTDEDRSEDTLFVIEFSGGTTEVRVDQKNNGNQWYRLDELPFVDGEEVSVSIIGSASGHANADAIALTWDESPAPAEQ